MRGAKAWILVGLAVVGWGAMSATAANAATPPLLPFNQTSDLYIVDRGCDCIVRVTPAGGMSVAVSKAQIAAATGLNENDFDLNESGIAFDARGNMYFVIDDVPSLLKRTSAGVLTELVSPSAMQAIAGNDVDPDGIAFGSDGFLYVQTDNSPEEVVRVNPTTGALSILIDNATLDAIPGVSNIDLEIGIVGSENGLLYLVTENNPHGIVAINLALGTGTLLASGAPFVDTDKFMTRAPNGDLIVADSDADVLFRVTPAGVVSVFLSENDLESVTGSDIDLLGGFAFDAAGNFYVTDGDEGVVLRFDTNLVGSVWLTANDLLNTTGFVPNLTAGIAFAPGITPNGVPVTSAHGLAAIVAFLTLVAAVSLRRAHGRPLS